MSQFITTFFRAHCEFRGFLFLVALSLFISVPCEGSQPASERVFSGVSTDTFSVLRGELLAADISLPEGPSGSVEMGSIKAAYSYDGETEKLSVSLLRSPRLISEETFWSILEDALARIREATGPPKRSLFSAQADPAITQRDFNDIGEIHIERFRKKMKEDRIVVPVGSEGNFTVRPSIDIYFRYLVDVQTLKVTLVDKPRFISYSRVWKEIEANITALL